LKLYQAIKLRTKSPEPAWVRDLITKFSLALPQVHRAVPIWAALKVKVAAACVERDLTSCFIVNIISLLGRR